MIWIWTFLGTVFYLGLMALTLDAAEHDTRKVMRPSGQDGLWH